MMTVNTEKCIGCGQCVKDCFPNDIKIIQESDLQKDKPELQVKKAWIGNETCMKCGHCIAVCPVNAITTDEYDMGDVKEYHKESFSISPQQLLNFIQFRRSVRQFTKEPVAKEVFQQIIEAGRFTQTGINAQDVSYIVITEELNRLRELVLTTLNAMGSHILETEKENQRLLRYAGIWTRMYATYQENPEKGDRLFFQAPGVILVTANSQINGALASSNMELMANALGLGTFFSGFFAAAAAQNPEILKFAGIPEGKEIVSCMVIGHPAVRYRRTVPRKSPDIVWK